MTEKIKSQIVPLLFGTSVASMIIRCYHSTELVKYNLIVFLYFALCFFIFDIFRKTKKLSGILYIALFLVVMYFTLSNIYVPTVSLTFSKWFYGAQTQGTVVPQYTFVLIFGGGFFLVSILYYFTQVIYRAFGTMLIIFFPLFIYAKRTDEILAKDFAIVLFFYILVLVHNRQMKSDKFCKVVFNKAYVCSVGLFVSIITVAVIILPQPQIISKQEKNKNYFNDMVAGKAPSNFSDTSNLTGSRLSDEVIFTVKNTRSMYLRRQAYDYYDDKRWVVDNEDEYLNKIPNNNAEYSLNTSNYGYVRLFSILKNEGLCESLSYPTLENSLPKKQTAFVNVKNSYNAYFLLLPLNTVEIDGSSYQKLCHGEYKPLEGDDYAFAKKYSFDYYPLNSYWRGFASQLDFSTSEIVDALDTALKNSNQSDTQIISAIDDIKFETEYVSSRFDDYSTISAELCTLANEITAGYSTPYEKATALVDYFKTENFEYQLNVYPDSVEEFVFDKKAGACGDFATAMTLMARACGLKARYVEGFVACETEPETDNTYIVREYHSHAYVEVYINGFGWVEFDPTVDGYLDYYKIQDTSSFFNIISNHKVGALILVCIVILLFVIKNKIFEGVFLLRLKCSNNNTAIILCYNRIVSRLSKNLNLSLCAKTPSEICEILKEQGIDFSGFVKIFEKVCYGNYTLNDEERNFVEKEYSFCKKALNKTKVFRFG